MYIKKWEDLPEKIKNEDVRMYYDILNRKKVHLILKRIWDIIMSLFLIFVLMPVFIIIGICIKLDSNGPIFYRQERVTQYGKVFKIFKFRTMIVNADKIGSLVTVGADKRITRVGKIIRKIRLDELPQLFNVFKGEMTFVGTRPEVKKYVEKYNNEMMATLLLPAGITSIASIKFKNEDEIIEEEVKKGKSIDDVYINIILPEKMKWNLRYIENFNVLEELKICVETIIKVIV